MRAAGGCRANDAVSDVVGCGAGTDTATLDNRDGFASCEKRTVVGALRLTPTTIAAQAGEVVRARLSWRHPRSWRNLRSIELRLVRDGLPVGEITIRPRRARISADGAVELARRHSRMTRKGKTVTARLAVRLDDSLAGRALTAEVEAPTRAGAASSSATPPRSGSPSAWPARCRARSPRV